FLNLGLTTTNALMSLDFPKRSDRKILERIIPPPSGGRDKLHFIRFQQVSQQKWRTPYQMCATWSISSVEL
ncbi:MAG: hypothetical protein WCH01_21030, partial [Methylococcaceae bacterium]